MRDLAAEYLLFVAAMDLRSSSISELSALIFASMSCARSSARLRAAFAESNLASER